MRNPLVLLTCLLWVAACSPAPTAPIPTLIPIPTELTPSPSPPMEQRRLSFWEPVTGRLMAGGADVWEFAAQSNDAITLRVLAEGFNPYLSLLSSDGSTLIDGEQIEVTLDRSGLYQVVVSDPQGIGGEYQLGLGYADRPNPNAIEPTDLPQIVGVPTPQSIAANLGEFSGKLTPGETVAGQIDAPDAEQVYTFDGRAGAFATLELTRVSGDIDPVIRLFDPAGQAIAIDSDSAGERNAIIRNVRLATTGLYVAQVTTLNGSGAYSLRWRSTNEQVAFTPTVDVVATEIIATPILTPAVDTVLSGDRLRDHVPVIGDLFATDAVMLHSFEMTEGEIFSLAVVPRPDSSLIPRLELVNPNGVPVAVMSGQTAANRGAGVLAFSADQSGPYTAFVTAEGGTSGQYEIAFGVGTTFRDVMRGEAGANRDNTSLIDRPGTRDVWHVTLNAGDRISASIVVPDADFTPILEIIDSADQLIGIDRDSGGDANPEINGVRVARTGVYRLRVRSANPEQTGAYSLVWRYIDVAPTATPPGGSLPILTLDDTVEGLAYGFYPFHGRAGQQVRVRVVAQTGSAIDPVAALLDPGATVIAEADDTDGNLNPVLTTTLPVDGTYSVRVNGYGDTGGQFTVIVEELY